MTAYADLEIALHRRDVENYAIEFRFILPESDAETRLLESNPSLQFNFSDLLEYRFNDVLYGQSLAESLFADPEVKAAFDEARSNAQSRNIPLRLRLLIDPGAPELHSLQWEMLRDPQDNAPLFTGEQLLFSRYLRSLDWRPVRPRARTDISALAVIANPANLDEYQLAPVDAEEELERVKTCLGNISLTPLAGDEKATLNNISTRLRDGYDILYLVCHGALINVEPQLWLENDLGNVARISGSDLVTRLKELQQPPQLVVLLSCQSAGSGHDSLAGDEGALAALGPRLAEVGIPAVLAMQGNVSMQTVAKFMPVFFAELQKDGQIDRAMAIARGAVRERSDWWMPVLFMRLKSGCLWYAPGFAHEFKWRFLVDRISQGKCIPILGPGLSESLLGSSREIAQSWAETFHFPMAPHDKEDLPQVAQYIAVTHDEVDYPQDKFIQYIHQDLLTRHRDVLPETLHDATIEELDKMIEAVGTISREQDVTDPYGILARLPFPIYITTSPDNLLCAALKAADRNPECELCRWNAEIESIPSIFDKDPDYRPTYKRPLIYQLFGSLQNPDSLVLTEDNYFDYLIGVTRNNDLMPTMVRQALVNFSLLFIGFQIDDWNFRVLYRSIMKREGSELLKKHAHVAVQVNLEEGHIIDPERARGYLVKYFRFQDTKIDIYWGRATDFIKELNQQWEGMKA